MRGCLVLAVCAAAISAGAETPTVDVEERLGATLPGELVLRDQEGQSHRLGELVRGELPTIVVPSSFECPMLCGLVLKGLVEGLGESGLRPGVDVRLATVSFDPRDTREGALAKQETALRELPGTRREDWPFFTGAPDDLENLTDALGYGVAYDLASETYAHPAAIVVLTPDGRISRYLYGVKFPRRDLRLAVTEAAAGRSGSAFDRILLACLRYDPVTRHYSLTIAGMVEIGAVLLALAIFGLAGTVVGREVLAALRERRAGP